MPRACRCSSSITRTVEGRCKVMNGSCNNVCQSISPRCASGESFDTTATKRSTYNGVNVIEVFCIGSNATPSST
ncbi:hypothetical protein D3C78_1864040 [compost metagenome]